MEKKIKFQYQVKQVNGMFSMSTIERYEVKELIHVCDPNKSDRENLDDAFCKACELGANPNIDGVSFKLKIKLWILQQRLTS